MTDKPRFSITLDETLFDRLERYRYECRFSTRSKAAVHLIEVALNELSNSETLTASSVRFVPLPESVMKMIGTGDPDELIYKQRPTTTNHNFARLRDKLGLKCRFHDLRHYSASILHAIGVPDQYIMERGGWRSDNVLKAVYRNTLSEQSVKFARISNEHFGTLL